ncbi:HD domain-containing protein, partial [Salmonella enterica subsp. enterica serovar Anatum]|nr:HD domain-containing protein [Salmonella enterica subsp. enterica serovar Anatum]
FQGWLYAHVNHSACHGLASPAPINPLWIYPLYPARLLRREYASKLDKLKFRDKKEAQAENFRKMIMAMVQDIRVILIKLADRTH